MYPIKVAAEDNDYRVQLFAQLGWDLDLISGFPTSELDTALNDTAGFIDTIVDFIENPPETLSELLEVLQSTKQLFTALEAIKNVVDASTASTLDAGLKTEFKKLGTELFDLLLSKYLEYNHPKLFNLFCLLGIIEPYVKQSILFGGTTGSEWVRHEHFKPKIHFDRFGELFANPKQYFKNLYFPASGNLDTIAEAQELSDKLFPYLKNLFISLGFNAWYGMNSDLSDEFSADDYAALCRTLTVAYSGFDNVEIGFTMFYEPGDEGGYGLVIRPFGALDFETNTEKWLFKAKVSSAIEGFAISNDGVQFPSTFSDSKLLIEMLVARLFVGSITQHQVGSTTGTRLELGAVSLGLMGNFQSGLLEYGAALRLYELNLIVGKEGDGFLNRLFPNGLQAKADLGILWTNRQGLHLEGSGCLEIYFAKHYQIGPVALNGLRMGLGFQDGNLNLYAAASIVAELGFLTVSVDDIGFNADIEFKESGGSLGKLDLDLGFKPPKGVGFTLKTTAVNGGGYLFLDYEKGRYVGALELDIKDQLKVTAIAVVTTKAPDGSKGFSLLAMVNVTFTPSIPLGLGFTLNGVGGLVAVNRRMSVEAIRAGVKSGSIDKILFPEKVLENIPTIVRDLEQVFPTEQGRYVFGLLFMIEWGTDSLSLLRMKFGLMGEFPKPIKLAIIGTLRLCLPSLDEPSMQVNVAFAGIIDFDAKYLTFDASIYDSKLMAFSLAGDIAVRLFWGEQSELLLSIGGFHPAYSPAKFLKLPEKMERMMIILLDDDNISLKLSNYFALTSNTAQFGARADFLFNTAGFRVIGLLAFDVLFQFNPFHLQAAIEAMLAVFMGKRELLSIGLSGSLEGPGPWHAQGHAEFRVLGVKAKVHFDETWGPAPKTTLPDVAVAPLILAELSGDSNWRSVFPTNHVESVTIRKIESGLVLHPSGQISIAQKIAPLGVRLTRFGTQKIADGGLYDIRSVTIGGATQMSGSETDQFAPANFRDMVDTDKLKAASFERLRCGVRLGVPAGKELYMNHYTVKEVTYDRVVIDKLHREKQLAVALSTSLVTDFVSGGVIGANDFGKKLKTDFDRPVVNVSGRSEKFHIVSKDSLEELSTLGVGLGPTVCDNEADVRTLLENILKSKPGLAGKIQAVPVY